MRSQLITSAALLLVAATLITPADAVCKNIGKKCGKDSPCCSNGWCDSKLRFCAVNCEPENSFSPKSCIPTPDCVNFETSFGNAKKFVQLDDFNGNPNEIDFYSDFKPNNALINSNGEMQLDLKYKGDAKNEVGNYGGFGATVTWTRLMKYGKVTALVKSASTSPGVVSSLITKSPGGDEIDFEWVGLDPSEVQSNYYFNNIPDWTKGKHHAVDVDTSKEYREYAIEWSPDKIVWWVAGKPARTLTREETKQADGSYKFPTELSHVQLSIWDGGMLAEGTAKWAGTPTNWSDKSKVYSMYVKSLKVECLNPGNATTEWPPAGYGPEKPKSKNNGKGGKDGNSKDASDSSSEQSNVSATTLSSTLYTAGFALVAVAISVIAF
ncbi:concanavalin A-like lectin/glucanase domain-containing protein [Syncephalis fuscata]|nr:concanavalin A-like lectin/glucanase domain-containing protein [Syncephalis fuscata]